MKKGFDSVNVHGCLSGIIAIPAIGENGNWFLGNDDTEVAAKGADGATGAQGIQGLKGDQGIQGIQGEKGDQGEKGTDADTAELERLSKEVDALDNSVKEVSTELESTKKSVADGKALIASAITEKGVTTAADATFQTMAGNISTMATQQYNSGYIEGETKSKGNIYKNIAATRVSISVLSINISSIYSNYSSINADNLVVMAYPLTNVANGGGGAITMSYSMSYIASTGIITLTGNSANYPFYQAVNYYCDIAIVK